MTFAALAQFMTTITAGDVIAIVSGIALCLANYFGMRSELRIMRAEMTPILKWWNRIAENQASRMFIRSRSTDEEQQRDR